MTAWEVRELKEMAQGVLCERKRIRECRRELARLTAGHEAIAAQEPALGLATACVLWMCLGDPRNYPGAAAYRKALGLNLTERSSGKFKGQLRLSKRGPHLGRKWLYFSAMRWMRDPAVKRWTSRKKARDGGSAMRALVAVMRRLALAAWHVAKHGVSQRQEAADRRPEVRCVRERKNNGSSGTCTGRRVEMIFNDAARRLIVWILEA